MNLNSGKKITRRRFLSALGATTAGVFIAPYLRSNNVLAYGYDETAVNAIFGLNWIRVLNKIFSSARP